MLVNKKKLKQYQAVLREIPKLKRDIDKLYKRLEDVPEVTGKVTKSSDDFPYIEQHITVKMAEPKQAEEIRRQIRYKELRLDKAERDRTEVERFIAGIEDSMDRQIFELLYTGEKRMTQSMIGDIVGYSQGRISQIIDAYLKD